MADPSNLDLRKSLSGTRADLQGILHEHMRYLEREDCILSREAGRMLANRIEQIENRQFIPAVRDEQGNLQSDVKMISQTFEKYYTKLYGREGGASEEKMDTFFF